MKDNKIIYKLYRRKDIIDVKEKLLSLSNDTKFNVRSFLTTRLITTIIFFFLVLLLFKNGYIYAPFAAVGYYYLFYYIFITDKIKKRIARLDYEALEFFEILTLTLASGRNLNQALKVTCDNVDSEISNEFKKALLEMDFGKSLIEALESMKKRIPSETINNIILNIIQTNQFGNSILDTMYNQIDFLREKQILDVKAEIAKLPTKISAISVVFFIPIILLIVLAPVVIEYFLS